jgi:hypothetical protein
VEKTDEQKIRLRALPVLTRRGEPALFDSDLGGSRILRSNLISYNEDAGRFEMIWRYTGKLKPTMVNDFDLRDPARLWQERVDEFAHQWLSSHFSKENGHNEWERGYFGPKQRNRSLISVVMGNRRTLAWVENEPRHPEIEFSLIRIPHKDDAMVVAKRCVDAVIAGTDPFGMQANIVLGHWIIEGLSLAIDNNAFIGEWRSLMAESKPSKERAGNLLSFWPPHMQPFAQATGQFVQRCAEIDELYTAQQVLSEVNHRRIFNSDVGREELRRSLNVVCQPFAYTTAERLNELTSWEAKPGTDSSISSRIGLVSRPFILDELSFFNTTHIQGEVPEAMRPYVEQVLGNTNIAWPDRTDAARRMSQTIAEGQLRIPNSRIDTPRPTRQEAVFSPDSSGIHPADLTGRLVRVRRQNDAVDSTSFANEVMGVIVDNTAAANPWDFPSRSGAQILEDLRRVMTSSERSSGEQTFQSLYAATYPEDQQDKKEDDEKP